ncbi:MAG: hypothetical protein OSJ70_04715 [Bacilli bacterium]|nr:hypothetical protein [Bacilli bacterium]
MELLSKYYKSLKEAINYLDNVKQINQRQNEAYEAIKKRIESLPLDNSESLSECRVALGKEKKTKLLLLFGRFLLNGCIVLAVFALAEFLLATSIPIFIPVATLVVSFMLLNHAPIEELANIQSMKKGINDANILLGNEKKDNDLKALVQELTTALANNETFITEFKQAIDEYMSLLLAQENKVLPYGPELIPENDMKILEDGLKKLNLHMGNSENE